MHMIVKYGLSGGSAVELENAHPVALQFLLDGMRDQCRYMADHADGLRGCLKDVLVVVFCDNQAMAGGRREDIQEGFGVAGFVHRIAGGLLVEYLAKNALFAHGIVTPIL
jgi:hypothetical protein